MHRLTRSALALAVLLVSLAQLWSLPVQAQVVSGITSPAPGAAISGDVPIFGTAVIDSFQKYELHYKQEPSGDDAFIYFFGATTPVSNGQLGVWQAGGLPPGAYSIRLPRGQTGWQLCRVLCSQPFGESAGAHGGADRDAERNRNTDRNLHAGAAADAGCRSGHPA